MLLLSNHLDHFFSSNTSPTSQRRNTDAPPPPLGLQACSLSDWPDELARYLFLNIFIHTPVILDTLLIWDSCVAANMSKRKAPQETLNEGITDFLIGKRYHALALVGSSQTLAIWLTFALLISIWEASVTQRSLLFSPIFTAHRNLWKVFDRNKCDVYIVSHPAQAVDSSC